MPGGGDGKVGGARIVVGLVEMEEGPEREEGFGRKGMNPVGDDERVAFSLSVVQSVRAIVSGSTFVVRAAGIVWNLKKVLPVLCVEPELIIRRLISYQRDEAAAGVGRIVKGLFDRRGEAEAGSRAGDAGIPGGACGVVAERELNFAGPGIAGVQ